MKKPVKIVVVVALALAVVALAVILALPLIIDPLVKTAATNLGPKVLGVPVAVDRVALNPFAGRLTISGLRVGNPPGYSDQPAFAIGQLFVDLQLASLMGNVIVVETIRVEAPAINYEVRDGRANFDVIQEHAGKSSGADATAPAAEDTTPAAEAPAKKVIIDLFELKDARVAYASGLTLGQAVTLPLPGITLRDIGRKSGGASAAEAVGTILNSILGGLRETVTAAAGDALQGAGRVASAAAGALGSAVKSAGVTNALQGTADSLSGAADKATRGIKKILPLP